MNQDHHSQIVMLLEEALVAFSLVFDGHLFDFVDQSTVDEEPSEVTEYFFLSD